MVFYRPLLLHLPLDATAAAVMGARFAKNSFSFTRTRHEDKEENKIFFIYKDYKGTIFFTTKRLAPVEQGAPSYNGRRYFQNYVVKAAEEEVNEISMAPARSSSPSGRRAPLDLDVR